MTAKTVRSLIGLALEYLIAVVIGFVVGICYVYPDATPADQTDIAVVVDGPGPIAVPYDIEKGLDRVIRSQDHKYVPLGSPAGQTLPEKSP